MSLPRRIILLLDGTWNEDDAFAQDTNIVRLRDAINRCISESKSQCPRTLLEVNERESDITNVGGRVYEQREYFVFYERGVGTGPGLDRFSGGILGHGLDLNVRRAYRFLSRHYMPGSEIFVFGFSRGAFTARSLVGYLGSAGLLRCDFCTAELEQRAWLYYRTAPNDRLPGEWKQLEKYVQPSGELRVACLGVFDTVGALGIPSTVFRKMNRRRYEFHDVELSPIVKLSLHALAVDEHRPQFEASVWRKSIVRENNSAVEQTWFPGAHADIGGGYYNDRARIEASRTLDDISQDWMMRRILHHFPDFPLRKAELVYVREAPKTADQHDSRTFKFRFSKFAFRAIANRRPPVKQHEKIVSYDRNTEVIGEAIHVSALDRLGRPVSVKEREDGKTRSGDRKEVYAPRNLIMCLPDLCQRYFDDNYRLWPPDAISIVSWSGEVLDIRVGDDQAKDELEQVRGALSGACDRLRNFPCDLEQVRDALSRSCHIVDGWRAAHGSG